MTVARTFSTVLNRSGESRHPCRGPDLRREDMQPFTTEHDVSCGFFTNTLYEAEEVPF